MESFSQAGQDLFYLKAHNFKPNGTFLEIGSNHPITHNNTYLAESKYGWNGLMIEYDRSFEQSYKEIRQKSSYIINDARNVNYRSVLDSKNFPTEIDYLQVDLDVDNRSTLSVLEILDQTVFDKYTFGAVTFEHDIYAGNHFDTQRISRDIFLKRGYKLVFSNVSVFWQGAYKPFEDWYIHPSIVENFNYSENNLTHEDIMKLLYI